MRLLIENRMLRDVEFFKTRVGTLGDHGNMAGDHLVTLVKAKTVPKTKSATSPPPPAAESPSKS
jgi:vacuolar protein sorting-associated protein 54